MALQVRPGGERLACVRLRLHVRCDRSSWSQSYGPHASSEDQCGTQETMGRSRTSREAHEQIRRPCNSGELRCPDQGTMGRSCDASEDDCCDEGQEKATQRCSWHRGLKEAGRIGTLTLLEIIVAQGNLNCLTLLLVSVIALGWMQKSAQNCCGSSV